MLLWRTLDYACDLGPHFRRFDSFQEYIESLADVGIREGLKLPQCRLQSGNRHTISYLDSKHAKKGTRLTLEGLGEQIWTITSASKREVSQEEMNVFNRMFKDFQHSIH